MRIFLLACALGSLLASPADALSSEFVVQFTEVTDSIGFGVQVGDLASGSFIHSDCADPACQDFFGVTDELGSYFDLGYGFDLLLGGVAFSSAPGVFQSDVTVVNGQPGTGFDVYSSGAAYSELSASPQPSPPDGFFIDSISGAISLGLTDEDGAVFDSGAIPLSLPPLDAFEQSSFTVNLTLQLLDEFGDPASSIGFSASGIVVAVPEPGTAVLLGLGCAGLAGWRRSGRCPS